MGLLNKREELKTKKCNIFLEYSTNNNVDVAAAGAMQWKHLVVPLDISQAFTNVTPAWR